MNKHQINQMVKNSNYINSFHGIENMTINHQGYIRWKGIVVGEFNFNSIEEENKKVKEIHSRCLHIESLGLIPTARNCDFYWNKKYKHLKPGTVGSAYPWVVDYYDAGQNRWKEIDEDNYDWYLECLFPVAIKSNAFLNGEPYTSTSEGKPVYLACRCEKGKYYAQLMTAEQFETRIYEPIKL
ncbi:MAG: hypothetical protein WBA41_00675 [Rivularia sp. (in: cyanobacteria)]